MFEPSFPVSPVIYYLNLNKIFLLLSGKSIILLLSKPVYIHDIVIKVMMSSNKDRYILLNYT